MKWGRCVFDNIRRFLQFQLTVNVVALTVAFVCALLDLGTPLNAVMMLWVNLIMDTMGALALATEKPTPMLFKRKPYPIDESLISAHMWRNIAVQSGFQLVLLGWLLFSGLESLLGASAGGQVKRDTLLFNTFVACQMFNELNARSIENEMNVFRGVLDNPCFVMVRIAQNHLLRLILSLYPTMTPSQTLYVSQVIIFTVITQFLLVTFGGSFTKTCPLSLGEWLITVGLGALSLPVGVLMRLMPHEYLGSGAKDVLSPWYLKEWALSVVLSLVPGLFVAGGFISCYHYLSFPRSPNTEW